MKNRARLPGCGSQLLHPAGCVLQGSHFIFCLGVPICKMGTGRVSASPGLCVCVCVCARTLSCVRIFVTSQTAAWDARDPLSRGFPRQEYWSGLPFPPPGDLPDPEMEPESPRSTCIGRQILYHCATWGRAVMRIKQVLQHSEN